MLENEIQDLFLLQVWVFVVIIRESAQGTRYQHVALIGLSYLVLREILHTSWERKHDVEGF